ncbi:MULTISPECIES: cell wall-active antibiotics response protein LiaF [Paraliobacillus]|uniref:cell wall-active antibiotics response protein LiaF n=1 Tax=Paraliobacillus TaxID=200903 RepID=UPI000E3E62BC|nr:MULTISPECIES: cell wall-active antibiotics response protein LiaF [Paraliobacillus]
MLNHNKMRKIHYVLLAIIIFFIYEVIFIHTESFIWIGIWLGMIYLARQYYYRPAGRTFFWIGLIGFIITLINTTTFQFILFVLLVFLLLNWYQSKQTSTYHQPQFPSTKEGTNKKVLFSNKWFGKQQTAGHSYQWEDINIQSAFGETVIDLTYTVLPKGEPLIIVRQLIGTIQIVIPFDVEVSVHHSVLMGAVDILDHRDDNMTNRVVHLQTENYHAANQKVKIVTSMIAGKIEVIRG